MTGVARRRRAVRKVNGPVDRQVRTVVASSTSKPGPSTSRRRRSGREGPHVGYAKQETIDPLKGLGRYVGFGVGGSLLLAIGPVALLGLAVLRALQTETGAGSPATGRWVPYLSPHRARRHRRAPRSASGP